MAYLDDLLARTDSMRKRRGQGSNVGSIMELIRNQRAIQAAQAPPSTGSPVQAAAQRAVASIAGGNGEADTLWNRLNQMINESPYKNQLKPGKRSRSYEEQVRLYNNYKAGKGPQAAKPGTSKHGNGRANDLQYGSPEARKWVLDNLARYGLSVPIYNPKLARQLDESWHIELGR